MVLGLARAPLLRVEGLGFTGFIGFSPMMPHGLDVTRPIECHRGRVSEPRDFLDIWHGHIEPSSHQSDEPLLLGHEDRFLASAATAASATMGAVKLKNGLNRTELEMLGGVATSSH